MSPPTPSATTQPSQDLSSSDPSAPQSSPTTTTTTQAENPSPTATTSPRVQALQQTLSTLQSKLSTLQTQRAALIHSQSDPETSASSPTTTTALDAAHATLRQHIELLHRYNEIRDVGMGLLGLVAEGRGVRVRSVMAEFGVEEGD